MFIKAFTGTLGALVAGSLWLGMIFLAVLALHVLVIGGMTVWYVVHS